jgi:Tol biopolymer transport system component
MELEEDADGSLIDLSTGQERQLHQLTPPAEYLGGPVAEWTPDSRAMVVRKAVDEKPEVWIVPIDGREPRKVDLGVTNYSGFQIKLSPDGRQIVFTAGQRPTTALRVVERLLASSAAPATR